MDELIKILTLILFFLGVFDIFSKSKKIGTFKIGMSFLVFAIAIYSEDSYYQNINNIVAG